MPYMYRAVATGLALTLLASCAGSDTRLASSSEGKPAAKVDEGGSEIVVTGQRVANAEADSALPISSFAPPPPPPLSYAPPPSSMPSPVMTSGRFAVRAAPEPRPYPPYYQDVGRDKFTATDQNAFKIVKEEPVSTFSAATRTLSDPWRQTALRR